MAKLLETARNRFTQDPRLLHTTGTLLWGALLVGTAWTDDPKRLPWVLLAGLLPVVTGLGVFLSLGEKAVGETVLLWGERVGIALGAGSLSGASPPLLLCALWPELWGTKRTRPARRLVPVCAILTLYLIVAIWRVPQRALSLLLGAVLYGIVLVTVPLWLTRGTSTDAPAGNTAPSPDGERPECSWQPSRPEQAPSSTSTDQDSLLQDLRVARDIQVSLLLASSPRLPGWEISTSFLPARELGGDLYDFVELGPRHRGIMIGDVSGKGIPAALHMAVARTLFRVEARQLGSPGETLARVNRALIEQAPQSCVSLLYMQLDIADGSLVLANAGHHYPILLDREAREIVLNGLPLGIDRDYVYEETASHLAPGDVLVLYTDGVIEATNDRSEPFGFERLRELLVSSPVRRPRSLTRQIVRAVRAFSNNAPQSDDITLLVLRRRYQDRVQELREVAADVLGPDGGAAVEAMLREQGLPPDAPMEAWQQLIVEVGKRVRDQWGQGPSRELTQQMFLALEGLG